MKPMRLTETDKKQLIENGHTERDFKQIEEAMQKSKTKYSAVNIQTGKEETIPP